MVTRFKGGLAGVSRSHEILARSAGLFQQRTDFIDQVEGIPGFCDHASVEFADLQSELRKATKSCFCSSVKFIRKR